jgi:glycosyltransferase involved in cell wall biosynthesis
VQITYLTHQYLPDSVGGTEVYTHGLALRAKRAGHSVHVITHVESPSLDPNDYRTRSTAHEDVPVTELHYNLSRAAHPARAEFENPDIAQLLRPVMKLINPDVVHVMHAMKLSGAAVGLCYELKIPIVLTLTDYWFICPRHTLIRWNDELCEGPRHDLDCVKCLHALHGFAGGIAQHLPTSGLRIAANFASDWSHSLRDVAAIRMRQDYLREIVERADRVIALSQFQKQMFVRNGYRADAIQVIQHGLDLAGLKPATVRGREPLVVIFIGSLVHHKGAHVLIEAMARRPDLNIELRIYGNTAGSSLYLDSIKQLTASDNRVRLMGTFPPADLGNVFETADALAIPALWYENAPLVAKAARYIGLPILASNIGTLGDSIQHGINGTLIAPGDVDAWANALASFKPTALAQDFSIKSMDTNAQELLAIYQEIHPQRCSKQNT